jgi:glyoxylase-like metal-dependent hydrolase (beta-lactamase superfamily II)
LETHVHADHLSAAQYLKSRLGGRIAMSEKISLVQKTFGAIYHFQVNDTNDMSAPAFDYLFTDGEYFQIGSLTAYNIPTPGHTPACLSYVIGDAVFVGDTVFMPDYGTARCDFPNGSASALYDSIQRLYQLDDTTRVFLCHDYKPEQRQHFEYQSSIRQQKQYNIHLNAHTTKQDFVAMREQRDATLDMPKLILPAIQVNMNAGKLPEPESNGIRYLKIPLNTLS